MVSRGIRPDLAELKINIMTAGDEIKSVDHHVDGADAGHGGFVAMALRRAWRGHRHWPGWPPPMPFVFVAGHESSNPRHVSA